MSAFRSTEAVCSQIGRSDRCRSGARPPALAPRRGWRVGCIALRAARSADLRPVKLLPLAAFGNRVERVAAPRICPIPGWRRGALRPRRRLRQKLTLVAPGRRYRGPLDGQRNDTRRAFLVVVSPGVGRRVRRIGELWQSLGESCPGQRDLRGRVREGIVGAMLDSPGRHQTCTAEDVNEPCRSDATAQRRRLS